MLILGGTYREQIIDPAKDNVFGSGLQGLRRPHRVRHSHPGELRRYGVARRGDRHRHRVWSKHRIPHKTCSPQAFVYQTPISTPTIYGTSQTVEPLRLDVPSQNVLLFGILEGEPEVCADAIVYDPQRPRRIRGISRDRLRAKRFAIVANAAETHTRLSGQRDLATAASQIASASQADVVVVKRRQPGFARLRGWPINPVRRSLPNRTGLADRLGGTCLLGCLRVGVAGRRISTVGGGTVGLCRGVGLVRSAKVTSRHPPRCKARRHRRWLIPRPSQRSGSGLLGRSVFRCRRLVGS